MRRMANAMMLLAGVVAAFPVAADFVREDELDVSTDLRLVSVPQQVADLRTKFPVASLEDEALKGLMYSALGWARNAAADETRTVTISAQAGRLDNGVFTPDRDAEITIGTGLVGEGTVDWNAAGIAKSVYQLRHVVRKGGIVDTAETLYGYFDFTSCDLSASQADVEAAVLGAVTCKIVVTQDEDWPWQPIDSAAVRSGIATDGSLGSGEKTATTFSFSGCGVLYFDHELTGGTLDVVADGDVAMTFTEATAGWVSHQLTFDGYGTHTVSFVYTANGGAVAAIRNVRWEKPDESLRTACAGEQIRVDLQEGEVRTPKKLSHVLPFVYSPTNFTGTVDGTSSRVSIVRLECGEEEDPADVTTWTTEVPGTARTLKEAADEGEVKWHAKNGVWKATFEIFDGTELKDTQIKYFDLREARGEGLVISIR